MKGFENARYNGTKVAVELAQSKGESKGGGREKTRKRFKDKKTDSWGKKRKRK